MTVKSDFQTTFVDLLSAIKQHETMPDWALGLKLGEEAGEVSEALLKAKGYLRHKELKEDVLHEIADVFNVCLGILVQRYQNKSVDEIFDMLNQAVYKKGQKYINLLKGGTPCPVCGEGKLHSNSKVEKLQYRGMTQTILDYFSTCDACKVEIAGAEEMHLNKCEVLRARRIINEQLKAGTVDDENN